MPFTWEYTIPHKVVTKMEIKRIQSDFIVRWVSVVIECRRQQLQFYFIWIIANTRLPLITVELVIFSLSLIDQFKVDLNNDSLIFFVIKFQLETDRQHSTLATVQHLLNVFCNPNDMTSKQTASEWMNGSPLVASTKKHWQGRHWVCMGTSFSLSF